MLSHIVPAPPIQAASGWSQVANAACLAEMRPTIVLRDRNLDKLVAIAHSVSDPSDPLYGQHLSTTQIAEMCAPAPQVRAALVDWLAAAGVRFRVEGRGEAWSTVVAEGLSGNAAGRLFGSSCSTYQRGDETAAILGDLRLPPSLVGEVAAVFGVHELLPPRSRAVSVLVSPAAAYPVTPGLIRSVYYVSNSTRVARPSASRSAVMQFHSQGVEPADLASFFDEFVVSAEPGDEKVAAFRGDARPAAKGTNEASLDTEYMMGVAPGVPTELWSYSEQGVCAGFVRWTSEALAMEAPPHVVSVSYGFQGDLSQFGCTPAMQATLESNHAKLAAAGVTVVHSSGDAGSGFPDTSRRGVPQCCQSPPVSAGGLTGSALRTIANATLVECCRACVETPSSCVGFALSSATTAATRCELFASVSGTTAAPKSVHARLADFLRMYPAWPATSPWVTAVGGTQFSGGAPGHGEEAASAFGSGGGFAVRSPQGGGVPRFQATAVEGYLARMRARGLLPPSFLFNASSRATPDVAVLGCGFQVIVNNRTLSIGGTSASAPTFAALVALINAARLAANKPPVGFVSPLLFQHPEAFTDITVGNNSIGRHGGTLAAGWQAAAGWDPVTGLGTPRFDRLLAAAMAAVGHR